ncbi:MAG: hypothetical protein DHS80DRAFT_29150 [Piptocephalis tieghemiana]|nr:MAG: hypothetical protein DHS80DRAFT_29150 [Piptocephalis tieghemiana]
MHTSPATTVLMAVALILATLNPSHGAIIPGQYQKDAEALEGYASTSSKVTFTNKDFKPLDQSSNTTPYEQIDKDKLYYWPSKALNPGGVQSLDLKGALGLVNKGLETVISVQSRSSPESATSNTSPPADPDTPVNDIGDARNPLGSAVGTATSSPSNVVLQPKDHLSSNSLVQLTYKSFDLDVPWLGVPFRVTGTQIQATGTRFIAAKPLDSHDSQTIAVPDTWTGTVSGSEITLDDSQTISPGYNYLHTFWLPTQDDNGNTHLVNLGHFVRGYWTCLGPDAKVVECTNKDDKLAWIADATLASSITAASSSQGSMAGTRDNSADPPPMSPTASFPMTISTITATSTST